MAPAVAIDTARAMADLEASGLDKKSARAVVVVVNEAVTNTAATAADLREVEGRLKQEIFEQGAALDKRITEQGAALDKRITEQGAALDKRITEQGAVLDKRITEQGAALEGKIAESGNKTLRGMTLLLGLVLALGAIWSTFVPAIRAAFGAP